MSDTLPPPPGSGRARRGNGLPSAEWGALVDLDPRLSEALLTRLGAAGVAAFVEPAGGEDRISRAAQHPARPLDRLWVDPLQADAAREVVAGEVADLSSLLAEQEPGATAHGFVHPVPRTAAARVLTPPALPDPPQQLPAAAEDSVPDGPEAAGPAGAAPAGADRPVEPAPGAGRSPGEGVDHEAAWRSIVEGYEREADGPVPPWPAAEDLDAAPRGRRALRPERPADPPPRSQADPTSRRRRRTDPPQELPEWVEPAALEDDGHYVPPPPPPVPRLAPQKVLAVVAVLLGFLLMFAPGALLQPRTTGVAIFGIVLTVCGAAAVVYLMRDAPSDSDPDDGAVV